MFLLFSLRSIAHVHIHTPIQTGDWFEKYQNICEALYINNLIIHSSVVRHLCHFYSLAIMNTRTTNTYDQSSHGVRCGDYIQWIGTVLSRGKQPPIHLKNINPKFLLSKGNTGTKSRAETKGKFIQRLPT